MKTENLLKISFVVMLIGILTIIILSNYAEPSLTKIQNINEMMIDEWVKINGTIIDLTNYNSTSIFLLEDNTATIKVVQYNAYSDIHRGMSVEIIGKVIEYKNELEIEASKIIVND